MMFPCGLRTGASNQSVFSVWAFKLSSSDLDTLLQGGSVEIKVSRMMSRGILREWDYKPFVFYFSVLKTKLTNVIRTNENKLSFEILFPKYMFQICLFTHCCGLMELEKIQYHLWWEFPLQKQGWGSLGQPGLRCPGRETWQGPLPTGPGCATQCKSSGVLSREAVQRPGGPAAALWIRQTLLSLPGKGTSIAHCLQESTSSDYLFTSEHSMGLQISQQISFQMTMPACPLFGKATVHPCSWRASVLYFLSAPD